MSQPKSLPDQKTAGPRGACSGRARSVIKYIDEQERAAQRLTMALTLPLLPNVYAELRYSHPMTSVEWDRMMTVLETMKPGIVR